MRSLRVVCLLSGILFCNQLQCAYAQSETQKDTANRRTDLTSGAAISSASDDPVVLTIQGLCVTPGVRWVRSNTDMPCEAVISQGEFEKLARAIQPDVPPASNRQLASNFPRLLVMGQRAEALGLDKDERFQEKLAYARLQILSQELVRMFQEEAAAIPAEDVEQYYREHTTAFEKLTFERVLIPTRRQTEPEAQSGGQNTAEIRSLDREYQERMLREAQHIRARAIAGESFAALQRQAYDAAGVTSPIPPLKFANVRRAALPLSHLSIFELKPGEISDVISDPTGNYIYRVEAKGIESRENAYPEIRELLQKQRMQKLMKDLQESTRTELNPSYFAPAVPPGAQRPNAASTSTDQD